MSDSATPWTAAHRASLSFTMALSLLKLMSIESVMPSNHFVLCLPILLLPLIPASGSCPMIRLFASGARVLEFQLQHQYFQWTVLWPAATKVRVPDKSMISFPGDNWKLEWGTGRVLTYCPVAYIPESISISSQCVSPQMPIPLAYA